MVKDDCLLHHPAKFLIQQFLANNHLALSHLESLWFSELPGADHQNRLYFHFPFQITGGTYESRHFSLYLPSDAIQHMDPACSPAEPEAPWGFPASSRCPSLQLPWVAGGTQVPLQPLSWTVQGQPRCEEIITLLFREPEMLQVGLDLPQAHQPFSKYPLRAPIKSCAH